MKKNYYMHKRLVDNVLAALIWCVACIYMTLSYACNTFNIASVSGRVWYLCLLAFCYFSFVSSLVFLVKSAVNVSRVKKNGIMYRGMITEYHTARFALGCMLDAIAHHVDAFTIEYLDQDNKRQSIVVPISALSLDMCQTKYALNTAVDFIMVPGTGESEFLGRVDTVERGLAAV